MKGAFLKKMFNGICAYDNYAINDLNVEVSPMTHYFCQGGMKAVLWADTLQTAVMMAGVVALLIRGCERMGGMEEVWRRAEEHGRVHHWE